jgi:tetratricopeptide (TPR) repeat protein
VVSRIQAFVAESSAARRAAACAALALYLAGLAAALGRPVFVAVGALALGLAAFFLARHLGQRRVDGRAAETVARAAAVARTGTRRAAAGARSGTRRGATRVTPAIGAAAAHTSRAFSRLRGDAARLARSAPKLLPATASAAKAGAHHHGEWRLRQAHQLNRRGTEARRAGRAAEAAAEHTRALEIYREAGDRRREALTLGNLALAEAHTDRESAVASCEAALTILRELDDTRAEGQILANLGALHHRAGRDDAAFRCWGDALERLDPSSPEHARIAERLTLAG